MDKIRGTSLGNWLVLEKWMSPQLFEGTQANDAIWLNRDQPHDELAARLKKQRDTYVTQADFEAIRARGLSKVRIPVPYFIFGDRPPLIGCIEYLDKAFDWAESCGMQILIDLYTVPGSQNVEGRKSEEMGLRHPHRNDMADCHRITDQSHSVLRITGFGY